MPAHSARCVRSRIVPERSEMGGRAEPVPPKLAR
jgi:hypothetical protein